MKRVVFVLGLAGVRVVNAWFYGTPLDVFIQRTALMIGLACVIIVLRALRQPEQATWLRDTSSPLGVTPRPRTRRGPERNDSSWRSMSRRRWPETSRAAAAPSS
jgi:hypothetical protein